MAKSTRKRFTVAIPENVKVSVKGRTVSVEGPLGKNVRSFNYCPMEIKQIGNKRILFTTYTPNNRQASSLKATSAHVRNMITGVTKGYLYTMNLVSAHFPIGLNIKNSKVIEIRNFVGGAHPRSISMLGETTVEKSTTDKDEIIIKGINVEDVGQSAASIHTSCLIRGKDIRTFLDGAYVSNKANQIED